MLISLSSDHKEHLQLLTKQSSEAVMEICELAIEFLHNGLNLPRITTAAEKLGTGADEFQNCIYGLIHLLLLSTQHKLSEADFRDSVLTLGFSQKQQEILSEFYNSKKKQLDNYVQPHMNEPHYNDLKWRFEAQVSSRSLLDQATPLVSMELSLKTNKKGVSNQVQEKHLQIDPSNLLHITNELERAVRESRSRHSRKIQRILTS